MAAGILWRSSIYHKLILLMSWFVALNVDRVPHARALGGISAELECPLDTALDTAIYIGAPIAISGAVVGLAARSRIQTTFKEPRLSASPARIACLLVALSALVAPSLIFHMNNRQMGARSAAAAKTASERAGRLPVGGQDDQGFRRSDRLRFTIRRWDKETYSRYAR